MKLRLPVLAILFCVLLYSNAGVAQQQVTIASGGTARVVITVADTSVSMQFAAAELSKYLQQISGASFTITAPNGKPAIRLQRSGGLQSDAYTISINKSEILLTGNSGRAVLYAVYHLLEQLGCAWLSPAFTMYNGKHEVVPKKQSLLLSLKEPISSRPVFGFRKIDVDGGRTHNADNLKLMVDWMVKARYNVLRVPVNLNGNGRVVWDKWRSEVLPELQKRDMILEIGGHGYQNFISAKMENETLFKRHPEWFGKDSSCNPSASERLVFNTENDEAVTYVINNILAYINQHPEINIFGLWPSDVGRWQDCKKMEKYGTPQDRQAAFANKVEKAIHAIRPDIVLELIAYSHTLPVPQRVVLSKNIQVDFCPINQSFEKQIYDTSSIKNREYAKELVKWRANFSGNIGLYSYYRKYAWRSAPNVIPHYIQRDMQWYSKLPLQGISTYAEPGDWFTYELNHFVLGQLAWNPTVNVDSLSNVFFNARFAEHSPLAKKIYAAFEEITPVYGSIPFTSLKAQKEIDKAKKQVALHIAELKETVGNTDEWVAANFKRLMLMLEYLHQDLEIQSMIAGKAERSRIENAIKEMVTFLQANLEKGVFILTGDNDFARFTKKYGLTNQSLLD